MKDRDVTRWILEAVVIGPDGPELADPPRRRITDELAMMSGVPLAESVLEIASFAEAARVEGAGGLARELLAIAFKNAARLKLAPRQSHPSVIRGHGLRSSTSRSDVGHRSAVSVRAEQAVPISARLIGCL